MGANKMYEKRYHVSPIRMFLFIYFVLLIFNLMPFLLLFILQWSGTNVIFDGVPLNVFTNIPLLIMAVMATFIVVMVSTVNVCEDGFIIRKKSMTVYGKGSKTVFNENVVINWDDIYEVKPKTLIFMKYLKVLYRNNYNRRIKSYWIPLSVNNKYMFIEDLNRYVPEGNPLKDYIDT